MNIRLAAAVAAITVAVAGCGKSHNDQTNDLTTSVATDNGVETGGNGLASAPAASPDQTFANTAAASDAFEIQSSQLAQDKSPSSAVKAFAKHMIEAHTASTAKLKTAAASASPAITPDPALTADQQQKLDQLKAQSGGAFDSAYIDDQIAAHQAALDGLRGYSATGDEPALKSFASQMVPTVTAHLNSAEALKH